MTEQLKRLKEYSLFDFWTVLMALFPILAITSGSLKL